MSIFLLRRVVATRRDIGAAFACSRTAGALTRPTGKPTTLAPTVAAGSTPKKSTEVAPKPAEGEVAPAEETAVPARTGSSSSSSSDEEKKKKAAKSKSRSVSRGKRASLFGGLLGKKEKVEEKVEEKKEEKKEKEEEKKDEPAVAAEPAAEGESLIGKHAMKSNVVSIYRCPRDCSSGHIRNSSC